VSRTQTLTAPGGTSGWSQPLTSGLTGNPDHNATAARPEVDIRPGRPGDSAAIRDFFAGLSIRARYLRFFAAITPTPAMLRVLSGDSDGSHPVLAIRDGAVIGHAMAVDRAGPPGGQTDIGVVVADAWQGHGVGSALVRALIRGAQDRGAGSLSMDVLPGNHQVLAMICGHWPAARIVASQDCLTINAPLPRQHDRPGSQRGQQAGRRRGPGQQHRAPLSRAAHQPSRPASSA
jgi:GNAT superfamily N-acetyltransferase